MGVDNDELECHLCRPPLTSIAVPGRRIGIEAAYVLDQRTQGRKPKPVHTFSPPVRVVARQSTDTLAVEDEVVASVLRLIHERAISQAIIAWHDPYNVGTFHTPGEMR